MPCRDNEKGKEEGLHEHGNPLLLKAFVEMCDMFITVKAHMSEGIFRKPGLGAKAEEYSLRIKNVGMNVESCDMLCCYYHLTYINITV